MKHFSAKARTLAVQIVLAGILSIILWLFFPVNTSKYIVEEILSTGANINTETIVTDFEADGYDERIRLANNKDEKQSVVIIFDRTGSVIDQWNLYEYIIPNVSFSGDFNNDKKKELFVYTKNDDSLFLYVIDPKLKPNFVKRRLFIARAENRYLNPSKEWDIYLKGNALFDINGDGFNELVFDLNSGYSQFPRAIFALDIKNEKIIACTPRWGLFVMKPEVLITPDNDTLVYCKESSASFNIHNSMSLRDDKTWFIIFNKYLQPKSNPTPIGKEFSYTYSYSCLHNDSLLFITLSISSGTLEKQSSVLILNTKGDIIRKINLPVSQYSLFRIPDLYPKYNFLCVRDSLFIINCDLSVVYFKKLPKFFYEIICTSPLLNKGDREILFFDGSTYWVADSAMENFTQINQYYDPKRYKVFPISGYYNGANLIIVNSNKKYFMKYTYNAWYPFRFLYPIGLYIICYFIIYSGNLYIRRRVFLHHFTNKLFLNAQRAMILLDHQGRIIRENAAVADILHLNNLEKNTRFFNEKYSEFPKLVDVYSMMKMQKKDIISEMTVQRTDEKLYVQIKGYLLGNKKNTEPLGYLIEMLDYTDSGHKEKMKMWADTVNRFAHDLKTPLASLFFMVDNIQQKLYEYPPELRNVIEKDLIGFTGEIKRLKVMIKKFGQFSDFKPLVFREVAVSKITQDALDELYALITPSITIDDRTKDSEISVIGDYLQLKQVMQILIKNSIEAISGMGEICIRVSMAQNLSANNNNNCIIEVCDTGSGISSYNKSRLFEPFFTTKPDGSGLGLSIAKKIVLDHQGQISIYKDEYFSTIARVMLPNGNNGVNNAKNITH